MGIKSLSVFVAAFCSAFSLFSQGIDNRVVPGQECLILDLPFDGNAQDLTANANHGTVHGAILTSDRFGSPNSAYEFDGIDDWIEFDTSGTKNNSYTFSVWAKTYSIPDLPKGYIALSIGQNGGDQQIIFTYYPSQGQIGWGCSSYSMGIPADTTVGAIGDTSKWHHLATVRNNNFHKFYLNGKLFGIMPSSDSPADYGSSAVGSIGARWGGYQFFHGKIDEVKIFNCELTDAQILSLYNGQNVNIGEDKFQSGLKLSQKANLLVLESSNSLENAKIELFNVVGDKVFDEEVGNLSYLEVKGDFPTGIYLLRIQSDKLSKPFDRKIYFSR